MLSWQTGDFRSSHSLAPLGHPRYLDHQTAWRIVVICKLRKPPHDVYRLGRWPGVTEEMCDRGGITVETFEEFERLDSREVAWRLVWLEKFGMTPLQRLGATNELIKQAGVSIRDWAGSTILD